MSVLSQQFAKKSFRVPTIALWLALLSLGWSMQPAQAGHDEPAHHSSQHHDGQLRNAARQLARDAERLYKRLDKEADHSPLAHQAHQLAEASERFVDEVEYSRHPRALERRFRTLADCLDDIKAQFHRHQYAYLSRKAEKRLDRTADSLYAVEYELKQLREQYSYRDRHGRNGPDWNRPDPYSDADRLPGTRPLWRR